MSRRTQFTISCALRYDGARKLLTTPSRKNWRRFCAWMERTSKRRPSLPSSRREATLSSPAAGFTPPRRSRWVRHSARSLCLATIVLVRRRSLRFKPDTEHLSKAKVERKSFRISMAALVSTPKKEAIQSLEQPNKGFWPCFVSQRCSDEAPIQHRRPSPRACELQLPKGPESGRAFPLKPPDTGARRRLACHG